MGNNFPCCQPQISNIQQNQINATSVHEAQQSETLENIQAEQQIQLKIKVLTVSAKAITIDQNSVFSTTHQQMTSKSTKEQEILPSNLIQSMRDYISFKKYDPRTHYTFKEILSRTDKIIVHKVISKDSKYTRVIKQIKSSTCNNQANSILAVIDKLNHPNIVKFYEVYEHNSDHYFVMEYLNGDSLDNAIDWKRCAQLGDNSDEYFDKIKMVAKQILYALCYLHNNKIAHLGIHTKSIMLSGKFQAKSTVFAKLIGFGSAKSDVSEQLQSVDLDFLMAVRKKCKFLPLQLKQKHSICCKTDVWMLGLALFQCISRINISKRNSFVGQSECEFHIYLNKIWNKLQEQTGFKQRNCIDLLIKMMGNNPDNRPTAIQCLEHPWFLSLELQQFDFQIKESKKGTVRSTLIQQKRNNLNTYIANLLAYKSQTQTQMAMFATIFAQMDKDHDGAVAIQELIDYFQEGITSMSDSSSIFEMCMELLNNIDTDGSGTIDFYEFSKALANKQKLVTKQAILEIFNHIDGDGDGHIVISELDKALQTCDQSQLQAYMRKIDKDIDGIITREQFINYCMISFQRMWQITDSHYCRQV